MGAIKTHTLKLAFVLWEEHRAVKSLIFVCVCVCVFLPWLSLRTCVVVSLPHAPTLPCRRASAGCGAGSLSPSGAVPPPSRRWRLNHRRNSTRRCSGRTWLGARIITVKVSDTRRRPSSWWIASTQVYTSSSSHKLTKQVCFFFSFSSLVFPLEVRKSLLLFNWACLWFWLNSVPWSNFVTWLFWKVFFF